jgi:toxin-antitoxin system PIN domain toxin
MLLPDMNVWLALTFDSHVHHPPAKSWFDALSGEVCLFCRTTQQGFLRLVTIATVFGPSALTLGGAWQMYDLLQSDPRVSYIDEPAGIEPFWRMYTERQSFSPKVWNDAYLAAFAQAANFQVVTFDRGFAQYSHIQCAILS